MGVVVGPFTVEDEALMAQAQRAAAAIPAAIANADRPGTSHLWASKRFGAPAWAFGYTPNRTNSWCNPRRHVVAHEYAHQWWSRHGGQVGGNAALRRLVDHPERIGTRETGSGTNRLSEAYAHAFAAAIGVPDGVQESFFQVKIPPGNWPALLAVMSKALAVVTRPTHINLLRGRVALRQSPQVEPPVVAWAESGAVIRSEGGLSGGPYVIPGVGDGSPSLLWLEVSALNGRLLDTNLWTAAEAWAPIPVEAPEP